VSATLSALCADYVNTSFQGFRDMLWRSDHVHHWYASSVQLVDSKFGRHPNSTHEELCTRVPAKGLDVRPAGADDRPRDRLHEAEAKHAEEQNEQKPAASENHEGEEEKEAEEATETEVPSSNPDGGDDKKDEL